MTLDIEKLRALCETATPGPWDTRAERNCPRAIVIAGTEQIADAGEHTHWTDKQCARNAAFIAAARSALPAALDEIAQLCEERDELRASRASVVNEPFVSLVEHQRAVANAVDCDRKHAAQIAGLESDLRAEEAACELRCMTLADLETERDAARAEVERLRIALAEAERERDDAYGVLVAVVERFDDGTLEVSHAEIEREAPKRERIGNEDSGDAWFDPVCGDDNDACSRETCPAIWVVNDAARIVSDAERAGRWRKPEDSE